MIKLKASNMPNGEVGRRLQSESKSKSKKTSSSMEIIHFSERKFVKLKNLILLFILSYQQQAFLLSYANQTATSPTLSSSDSDRAEVAHRDDLLFASTTIQSVSGQLEKIKQTDNVHSNADDEDVVISSSEILSDKYDSASSERGKKKAPDAGILPDSTKQEQPQHQQQQVSKNPNCTSASTSANWEEKTAEGGGDNDPDDPDERNYSNSRLLLRLLVIGLFALVTLSLLILYSIKLCLCRRRKRRLQRDLVADSSVGASYFQDCLLFQQQSQNQCFRHQAGPAQAAALHSSAQLLRNMFRERQTREQDCCFLGVNHSTTMDPIVPSLSSEINLRQLNPPNEGAPISSGRQSCSCYSVSGQRAAPSNFSQTLLRPPPTYSELFGQRQLQAAAREAASPSGSSEQDNSAFCESSSASRAASQRLAAAPQAESALGSTPGDCSLVNRLVSPEAQDEQKNLLVKLNLNKTKLLSAGDLMLLSKLIDVPIIVQDERHQQRQLEQQQQQHHAVSNESSFNSTTITISTNNDENCSRPSAANNDNQIVINQANADFDNSSELED